MADEVLVIVTRIEADMKTVKSDLLAVKKSVWGNGENEKSLTVRVAQNRTYLKVVGAAVVLIPSIATAIVVIIKLWK